jgi:hypothetical protein
MQGGGRLTLTVLALCEIENRLGIADRLAGCVADPRDLDRITHGIADSLRF